MLDQYNLVIMEAKSSICMEDYIYKDNLIYRSKESEVYKAINKNNPQATPFIFKGYSQDYLTDPLKQKKLMQELDCLWKLHGKNHIAQIISQHPINGKVFIIFQFYDHGTLAAQIKKQGKFSEQKSMAYMKQIIEGYKYIYQANIIHRNLQPSSILSTGFDLKIGDFSDSIRANQTQFAKLCQQIVGNIHYQPYETLSGYSYSVKSDIYSLGAILYCMVKGKPPYEGSNKLQILQSMKEKDLKQQYLNFKNAKVRSFLQKTLICLEKQRMDIEQLLSYDFSFIPQLNKLKLYTFDDRQSLIEVPLHQQFSKVSAQNSKYYDKVKQDDLSYRTLFKNFGTSNKKFSLIDLKISDDEQLSRFYKDGGDISIFIPTRLDLNQSQPSNEAEILKKLQLERVQSYQKRPSEGLPLKKKAGTNKDITNHTYHDLLKSQTLIKAKAKNLTSKDLPIISQKSMKSIEEKDKIRQVSIEEKQQRVPSIQVVQMNSSNQLIPPLTFGQHEDDPKSKQSFVQQNKFFSKKKVMNEVKTERTAPNGQITLRGRQNIIRQLGDWKMHNNSQIACWFVSQIDMFRFLNRTLYKIKKYQKRQLEDLKLQINLLQKTILFGIKNLDYLSNEELAQFKNSLQYERLIQIMHSYEPKDYEEGQFQGYQNFNKRLIGSIMLLYKELLSSQQFRQNLIKLLDYLVTLWQLLKILKRNNLQYFYQKSKIQQILDSPQSKLTIAHLLQLYERMKGLKLV